MAKCGMEASDAQLAELLKAADADGSGGIDFVEFVNMIWGLQTGPTERELRVEMFTLLDDNLDGYIEAAEVGEAFARLAADKPAAGAPPAADMLQRMVAEAAADGKRMTADDFAALLRKLGLPKTGGGGGAAGR